MKLVIIESPYKGDVERNKRYLQACIRDCLRRGESPYASHQMLTDALDDNDPEQRKLGIEAGLEWRKAWSREEGGSGFSAVVPIFYEDLGWSEGMQYARIIYEGARGFEVRKLPEDDPFFTFGLPAATAYCEGCGC